MRRRSLFPLLILVCMCGGSVFADDFRIVSAPSGSSVEIDGNTVGTTPWTWSKLPGGYFRKTHSVFGARLERPLHARVTLPGYVTQDVELTFGPMKWIALNGTYHGDYYLLKDRVISVTLLPEAKVFTGTLSTSNSPPPMRLVSAELPLEDLVERTSSAVLKLSSS